MSAPPISPHEQRRSVMVHLRPALVTVTLFCAAVTAACGGRQHTNTNVGESEEVAFCDAVLNDLHGVSLDSASEAELVEAMTRAESAAERCEVLLDGTDTTARLFAAHKVRGLRIHSLWFEAALSRRFDNGDGYCEILTDAFNLLAAGILEIDTVLADREQISVSDEVELRSLRDLDLEALDVLYLGMETACQ